MATTSLIENFQALKVRDGSNDAQRQAICLPFNPGSDFGIPSERRGKVDRYLFRVFDEYSDGSTDSIWAKSRDANHHPEPRANSYKDIFARDDRCEAAQALRRHLQWDGGSYEEDNFVSWSSSLLVVLQYAHYRARRFCDGNFESVFLCVVDTTLLPPMSFMRDMDLLTAFSRYDDLSSGIKTLPQLQSLRQRKHREYTGSYYFGEYLSQGALRIEDRCRIMPMQDIIDAGLYTLREELKPPATGAEFWANKVIMLREQFYMSHPCHALGDKATQAALHIGDLYGTTWILPITLAFLALEPRLARDEAMIMELRHLYCEGELISILLSTRAEANIAPKMLKHFHSHLKRRRWFQTTLC